MDIPSRKPLFEQIHDILSDKIRSGEISPGERLKDIVWAKKLGVSRTPVREAMRKMQQEGVLNLLAHGGYEVRSTSQKDLIELYRCRAALEALATEDAAAHADEKLVQDLTQLVDDCDAAIERGDLDAAFSLNTKFHTAIIARSDNAHLASLLDTLRKLVLFYRGALLNAVKNNPAEQPVYLERLRIKQDRHREILAAITARDASRAASLMSAHVRETAEDLLPLVSESRSGDSDTMAA